LPTSSAGGESAWDDTRGRRTLKNATRKRDRLLFLEKSELVLRLAGAVEKLRVPVTS